MEKRSTAIEKKEQEENLVTFSDGEDEATDLETPVFFLPEGSAQGGIVRFGFSEDEEEHPLSSLAEKSVPETPEKVDEISPLCRVHIVTLLNIEIPC